MVSLVPIRRSAYFSRVFLRRADLEAILSFVVDVGELDFDRLYPAEVVARLADLVPCASLAYQEVDRGVRRTTVLVGIHGDIGADDEEDELGKLSLTHKRRSSSNTSVSSPTTNPSPLIRRKKSFSNKDPQPGKKIAFTLSVKTPIEAEQGNGKGG